jgi:hypothetical protein
MLETLLIFFFFRHQISNSHLPDPPICSSEVQNQLQGAFRYCFDDLVLFEQDPEQAHSSALELFIPRVEPEPASSIEGTNYYDLDFELPYDQQFNSLFPRDTEPLQRSSTLQPTESVDWPKSRSQFPCRNCASVFKRQCDVE